MKTHNLKVWKQYFLPLLHEEKTFELRKNDRDYQVGDILILIEIDGGEPTGRYCKREITYILENAQNFGLIDGFVILGLKVLPPN